MRNYLGKLVLLSVILFVSPVILAAGCALNGGNCKLKQDPIQNVQDIGVKPMVPVKATLVDVEGDKQDKSKRPTNVEVKPFEVPPPSTKSNRSTVPAVVPQNQETKKSTFNIFTPETNTNSTNQNEESGGVVNQESTSSTTQQQTGIQYR